jgi:NAD+ kinase
VSGVALVLTHRAADETSCAIEPLKAAARRHDFVLRFDPAETAKHGVAAGDGIEIDWTGDDEEISVCVVLGGDGTILSALRRFALTRTPVFAVNFGEVGFLATVERDEMDTELERAFAGDFEVLPLPAVVLEGPGGSHAAINDVSVHRKVGERVAQLGYAIQGEEVGSVRCDGVVVATPAGSTGYNLANGGPVLAWGVEGFVVSFIAPHSLTARALVVAPNDVLTLQNRSADMVDLTVDGRPVGELGPGLSIDARFQHDVGSLAQVPGSTFYRRLREKFGRLSA